MTMVQRVNRNVDFVTDDDNNLVGFQVKPGDVRALAQLATDASGVTTLSAGNDVLSVIVPKGGDHEIMMAQEWLKARSPGGYINLSSNVYSINNGLVIDVGSGIGIRGNGSYLDARGVAGGASALTLASNPPDSAAIAGVDTNTTNYHGKRVEIEGFTLVGLATGSQTHHGIDINMSPAVATRAPRPTVRNVTINGFDRQIRHRNFAYLATFMNGICNNGLKALSLEGGVDQGEQSNFYGWTFGNGNIGLYIDTQPETGTPENVDVNFDGCSFDYNTQQIVFTSGYGRIRFKPGCHFEWNSSSSSAPFDLSVAAANRLLWLFDSPNIFHTGGSRNWRTAFVVGNNHDVRVKDYHAHNLAGVGVQMTTNGSPTGTETVVTTLATVTGTGRFKANDISDLTSTSLPRAPSINPLNNWLWDGGFEQASLVDLWYVRAGGFGAITRITSDKHTGAACLQVAITTANATTKQLAVLVRKRGRFVGISAFLKLSAGSGSIDLRIAPAVCKIETAPGTAPTPEYTGTLTTLNTSTLSAAGWVNTGQAGNQSRYELPEWATHALIVIDGYNINNNGGNLFVDDVHVETW
jgi:hypothetical protein